MMLIPPLFFPIIIKIIRHGKGQPTLPKQLWNSSAPLLLAWFTSTVT